MRRKILAFVLAVWMALSILPMTVRASGGYEISMELTEGKDHGSAELHFTRAEEGETVWLLAEPAEGYVARVEGFWASGAVQLSYAGLGGYAFSMPAGDVELQVRFLPAGEERYPITGTVNAPALGALTIHRSEAAEGEWVIVEAAPRPGCLLSALTALGTDGLPVRGGYVDTRDGILIYEYCLPDVGIVIEAEFFRERRLWGIQPRAMELR